MGRRAYKKVTVNGALTLHQRYLYRGYLQIACIDLTRTAHPCLWLITWDPTQPIATRPLAIQKDGTWYTYGLDLTKNVCEVFGTTGYIGTAYTYSPYGEVTVSGNVEQPIKWSSEYSDEETGLTYYNWRYYDPLLTWIRRDNYISDDKENKYGISVIYQFYIDAYYITTQTITSHYLKCNYRNVQYLSVISSNSLYRISGKYKSGRLVGDIRYSSI